MIIKEKPTKVILTLKENEDGLHLSELARRSGTTYVYITHFISVLKIKELVEIKEKGKRKIAKLTEKGKKLAGLLEEVVKIIE